MHFYEINIKIISRRYHFKLPEDIQIYIVALSFNKGFHWKISSKYNKGVRHRKIRWMDKQMRHAYKTFSFCFVLTDSKKVNK